MAREYISVGFHYLGTIGITLYVGVVRFAMQQASSPLLLAFRTSSTSTVSSCRPNSIRTSGFCLGCLKLLPTAPLFEGSSASCCVLISPQIGLIFCTDVHYQCVKRRTKFGDCQMIVAKDIDHASWHRCRNLAVLVKKRRPRCTQMRSASLET